MEKVTNYKWLIIIAIVVLIGAGVWYFGNKQEVIDEPEDEAKEDEPKKDKKDWTKNENEPKKEPKKETPNNNTSGSNIGGYARTNAKTIKLLQKYLNIALFFDIDEDGVWGHETEKAFNETSLTKNLTKEQFYSEVVVQFLLQKFDILDNNTELIFASEVMGSEANFNLAAKKWDDAVQAKKIPTKWKTGLLYEVEDMDEPHRSKFKANVKIK